MREMTVLAFVDGQVWPSRSRFTIRQDTPSISLHFLLNHWTILLVYESMIGKVASWGKFARQAAVAT